MDKEILSDGDEIYICYGTPKKERTRRRKFFFYFNRNYSEGKSTGSLKIHRIQKQNIKVTSKLFPLILYRK